MGAIGNIVSNNVFLLVDGIICLTFIHNCNQHDNFKDFMKTLVIINASMIPPALFFALVGILQFEVAAQLLKKEEAETKEQCENPSISKKKKKNTKQNQNIFIIIATLYYRPMKIKTQKYKRRPTPYILPLIIFFSIQKKKHNQFNSTF